MADGDSTLDLNILTTEFGREYHVHVVKGTCHKKNGEECPDQEYSLDDDDVCKHVHRARYAIGLKESPEWIDEDAVDDLGAFVPTKHDESDTADADTLTGRKAATDGDVSVREATTDTEIFEDESDPWEGQFPEVAKYDHPSGEDYVRCRDCGREILTGRKEHATHKEGCRFGEDH